MSLQHLTPPYDKPEDFQHLYEEMHMSVFRYIYSLRSGPQQDVEDLTADTFSRAWNDADGFMAIHKQPWAGCYKSRGTW